MAVSILLLNSDTTNYIQCLPLAFCILHLSALLYYTCRASVIVTVPICFMHDMMSTIICYSCTSSTLALHIPLSVNRKTHAGDLFLGTNLGGVKSALQKSTMLSSSEHCKQQEMVKSTKYFHVRTIFVLTAAYSQWFWHIHFPSSYLSFACELEHAQLRSLIYYFLANIYIVRLCDLPFLQRLESLSEHNVENVS